MLRSNMLRAARGVVPSASPQVFSRVAAPLACQQSRSAHAISNPELANIEKRWDEMPPQEQAELWMNLRDRMKAPWTELTLQEKKAGMPATKLIPIGICIHLVAACRNVLNVALSAGIGTLSATLLTLHKMYTTDTGYSIPHLFRSSWTPC